MPLGETYKVKINNYKRSEQGTEDADGASHNPEKYKRHVIEDVGADDPSTGTTDAANKADNKTDEIYGDSNNGEGTSNRRSERA